MPWIDVSSCHNLTDKTAESLFKAVAGDRSQLRKEVQITCRRRDANVTHVESQLRQIRLHIGAVQIPTDERPDCKAVTQIVNAGPSALAILNICGLNRAWIPPLIPVPV